MTLISQIIFLLLFLAFAHLAKRDIRSGIYAVIFLLPCYLVRFSLGGIPTTMLEIMIYVLFLSWLIRHKKNLNIVTAIKNFFAQGRMLPLGLALLLLGVVLSTAYSSDLRTSLGALKGWFIDPFLFFLVFTSEIKERKQTAHALASYILSASAVALIGILYSINNTLTFDGRLRAFYESPNYLAMYLAPAFLFAIYFFVNRRDAEDSPCASKGLSSPLIRKLSRNITAQSLMLMVLAGALFMTKSYGAILGIGAALVCLLLKRYRTDKKYLPASNRKTLLALAAVALVIFSLLSYQKYAQITSAGERSSLSSRFMIWDASMEMINDSPFFGIGPGTFQEVYLDYQQRFTTPYLEWAVPQPHNTLLAFYLQSGMVGFIGFVLILLFLCKRARTDDVVFLFLVYFLVHGLVDTLYWKNDLAMIFVLVAGIGYLPLRKK